MKYFSIIVLLIVTSCSKEVNELPQIPKSSGVEALIAHSQEFNKELYSFSRPGGLIHVAVGYGIANSIMVEGEGGNIIIDASDSTSQAAKVHELFKSKNNNPIKAIIYTHNHGDHTFGAEYYINNQQERPQIISHETTDHYTQRIMGIINPIISKRSTRMFGTLLPDDQFINAGIGSSLNVSDSPIGYIKPDTVFRDELKITISGIDLELYHAPGETNDQIFVWLPQHKSLMPGDNIYNTFPNLYTIRGTTHRNVTGWIDSLDHMRSFKPKYLFPSHTKPIEGEDATKALIVYRDAIQFVHDQTIRFMNKGYYPNEIVQMINLPPNLASSPLLREFYGTVRWSVKSIYNGYLGWFDGNPSSLDPLPNKLEGQKIASLVGGNEILFSSLEAAVNNEDMQWALQLSDYLINLEFRTVETNKLRKEALLYIGSRASNPNKRNYFLTAALELDPSFEGFPEVKKSDSILNEINLDTIFNILSVSFNPENSYKGTYSVCFRFNSGQERAATIRNSVLEISKNLQHCDLNIKTSERAFKETLAGLKNPVLQVASGKIDVEESEVDFLKFLALFK